MANKTKKRRTFTEITGSVATLKKLADKHGFKYRPGDRVFKKPDGSIRAFRVIRGGKDGIFAERVRRAA